MNEEERHNLIKTSWEIHGHVESAYLSSTARQGDKEWLERQRLLLADMALHLLQTSMKTGEIDLNKLRDNLHAIMTISDQFLPNAGLKKATKDIYT